MANKNYIDEQELLREIQVSRKNKGASTKLCKMLFLMCDNILKSGLFRNYNLADKDDMKSEAVITCVNSLFKFNIKKSKPFSYFTSIIYNSYFYYLKRKYKHDNFKMEFYEDSYIQANKPFVNEYKKDTLLYNKNLEKQGDNNEN